MKGKFLTQDDLCIISDQDCDWLVMHFPKSVLLECSARNVFPLSTSAVAAMCDASNSAACATHNADCDVYSIDGVCTVQQSTTGRIIKFSSVGLNILGKGINFLTKILQKCSKSPFCTAITEMLIWAGDVLTPLFQQATGIADVISSCYAWFLASKAISCATSHMEKCKKKLDAARKACVLASFLLKNKACSSLESVLVRHF